MQHRSRDDPVRPAPLSDGTLALALLPPAAAAPASSSTNELGLKGILTLVTLIELVPVRSHLSFPRR